MGEGLLLLLTDLKTFSGVSFSEDKYISLKMYIQKGLYKYFVNVQENNTHTHTHSHTHTHAHAHTRTDARTHAHATPTYPPTHPQARTQALSLSLSLSHTHTHTHTHTQRSGDNSTVERRTLMERSRVQVPAGAAGECSSPGSTFCANFKHWFTTSFLLPLLPLVMP